MTQSQGGVAGQSKAALSGSRSARAQWVAEFSAAFLKFGPHGGQFRARRIACELWVDLKHFDPVLAAEMEYESSLCDA